MHPRKSRRQRASGSGRIPGTVPRKPSGVQRTTYGIRMDKRELDHWRRAAALERIDLADLVRKYTGEAADRIIAAHEAVKQPK